MTRSSKTQPESPAGSIKSILQRDAIESILIACARAGRDISYSELFVALGLRFSRPKVRPLCKLLGEIDRERRAEGLPELAVLVVRSSDRLPGEGWWQDRSRYQGPSVGPRATQYVRRLQCRLYAYYRDPTSLKLRKSKESSESITMPDRDA